MTSYSILNPADRDGEPIEAVTFAALPNRIGALSGRNVWAYKSVRESLRRKGSVYIAVDLAGEAKQAYGLRGFIVQETAT